MIAPETPCAKVQRLRQEMKHLFALERNVLNGNELMNVSFALRRAHQEWFDAEVHTWTQLPLNQALGQKWDAITDWCSDNLKDEDWLIFLPKGEPKALYFRNAGDAVMIKLMLA